MMARVTVDILQVEYMPRDHGISDMSSGRPLPFTLSLKQLLIMMPLRSRLTYQVSRITASQTFTTHSSPLMAAAATKRKRVSRQEEEIHRPSLSGSSVGHLFSEINAMRPGMEALRPDGQTMTEDQRAFARRTATWLMGVPVLLGAVIVGGNWLVRDDGQRDGNGE
jgi:hypothetical protein